MKKRLSFEQTLIVLGHLKPPILVAYVEKKIKKQKASKQTNKQKENSFRVQSESTRIRQK